MSRPFVNVSFRVLPLFLGMSGNCFAATLSGTCAIDQLLRVECWGRNSNGALGLGFNSPYRAVPTPVIGLATPVVSISSGVRSCAITNGNLYCWGDNSEGELADGTTIPSARPLLVPGLSSVTAVVTGDFHTCAINDGSVFCWGNNDLGSLGDGTGISKSSPTLVGGIPQHTAVQIAAGHRHACAVTVADELWCWGPNNYGQLGEGSFGGQSLIPVKVSGLPAGKITSISAGNSHTCALFGNGEVWCWGFNGFGQLGIGTNADMATPVHLPLPPIAKLISGVIHTCAATVADGSVYCWGYGEDGQLGSGEILGLQATPVLVPLVSAVVELSAGFSTTCAKASGGSVWCWGSNFSGDLGDGTTLLRDGPVMAHLGDGIFVNPFEFDTSQ